MDTISSESGYPGSRHCAGNHEPQMKPLKTQRASEVSDFMDAENLRQGTGKRGVSEQSQADATADNSRRLLS